MYNVFWGPFFQTGSKDSTLTFNNFVYVSDNIFVFTLTHFYMS